MNLIAYQHLKYDGFLTQEVIFKPSEIIKDIIAFHQADVRQSGIDIVYLSEPHKMDEVIADCERAMQVLQNVIRQAQRLAKKGSKIELDCWVEQQTLEGRIFFSVSFEGA